MGNMREISIEECSAVFGGTDDIVVRGEKIFSLTGYLDSSGAVGDRFGLWGFGKELYDAGQMIADAILNQFGSDMVTDAEAQQASEEAISTKFNATTPSETKRTSDGRVVVTGSDGWQYHDRDGNGVFDYRQRFNADGSITRDNGTTTAHIPPPAPPPAGN